MALDQEGGFARIGEATVACGPEAASAARTVVSRWLHRRANPEFQDDARLLVSELVSNSVQHADQPHGAPLHISAFAADGIIRVEVEDRGQGAVRRRTGDPRTGGFGLQLVELLAARWGVTPEHTTRVWFELAASGSARAHPSPLHARPQAR